MAIKKPKLNLLSQYDKTCVIFSLLMKYISIIQNLRLLFQENKNVCELFSISPYQELPENTAVIWINMRAGSHTFPGIIDWIDWILLVDYWYHFWFLIIPCKLSNGLHTTFTFYAHELDVSFSMKYKVCKLN